MLNKFIIFDISAEYGHFRKFNTTSSPLTYSIPTPTALCGIIGAILGLEREIAPGKFESKGKNIYQLMHELRFGIQLLNPVKKVNIGFNLLDTEKKAESYFNITNRTQVEFELLKDPSYRIYLACTSEDVYNDTLHRIETNCHHFTPYLGLSQFTAKINFIDEVGFSAFNGNGEYQEIISALNLSRVEFDNPVLFDKIGKYSTDTIPLLMNESRIVQDYGEILIEAMGKSINAKVPEYYEVEGNKICLL